MYNIIYVQSSTRHPSVGWFAQGSSLSSGQASQDAVFVLFARRYDDDDDDRYDCKSLRDEKSSREEQVRWTARQAKAL